MKALDILTELVRCPSVNPESRGAFEAPYGEAAMADVLTQHLRSMGGEVHREEVHLGRPNIWARFAGRDRSRSILLDAHSDTVSHLHMTVDPFGAEVKQGRLFGRGACDTKGSAAAMLLALEQTLASGGPATDVVFAATCNEENGGTGASAFVRNGPQIDFAIVGEPTDLQLVTRHKGVLRARISILGKAAHSSTPDQGCNAIYNAAQVVSRLEELSRELSNRRPCTHLGRPSLAVVTIEGGTAVNIVPNHCVLQVDRRVLPGEDEESVKGEIMAAVEPALKYESESLVRVEWTQHYPGMYTPEDTPELARLSVARKSIIHGPSYTSAPYATNAGFYAHAGIPSVVFGPGSISDAHTANESIDLHQVEQAADILCLYLTTLPSTSHQRDHAQQETEHEYI